MKYEDLGSAKLFEPLGIKNYCWTWMRQGVRLAAGGLYLTTRPMVKIGQMMLDAGEWRGRRIVSRAWVEKSTRQQTTKGGHPYGFYWHLNTPAARHFDKFNGFAAMGQGGQLIVVVPEQKLFFAVTSADWALRSESTDPATPLGFISRFIIPETQPIPGTK